jgi:Ni/Co efflux regulator RcnB
MMKRSLIVLAIASASALPVLAQKADYCSPSGYVEGVTNGRDFNHKSCDTNGAPRVNGVPQGQPQRYAQPGYNNEQAARAIESQRYQDQRAYEQRAYNQRYYDQRGYDQRAYDSRSMGNRDSRDWDRYRGEGQYYYGARGPEWRRGGHIPREYMSRQYYVDDWRAHHLSAPPRGYQWVQVGDDYVLVALATGIISQLLLSH